MVVFFLTKTKWWKKCLLSAHSHTEIHFLAVRADRRQVTGKERLIICTIHLPFFSAYKFSITFLKYQVDCLTHKVIKFVALTLKKQRTKPLISLIFQWLNTQLYYLIFCDKELAIYGKRQLSCTSTPTHQRQGRSFCGLYYSTAQLPVLTLFCYLKAKPFWGARKKDSRSL